MAADWAGAPGSRLPESTRGVFVAGVLIRGLWGGGGVL